MHEFMSSSDWFEAKIMSCESTKYGREMTCSGSAVNERIPACQEVTCIWNIYADYKKLNDVVSQKPGSVLFLINYSDTH